MFLFQTAKKHSHCPPRVMANHSYSICLSRSQSNAMRGSVHRSHGLRMEQNLNRIASNSAKTCDIALICNVFLMRLKRPSCFTVNNINQLILFNAEDYENKFPFTRGQFRPNLEDILDNMHHLNNDRAGKLHT